MAGWDNPTIRKTMIAGATIRKGQFVKLSSGEVIPCSVLGEAVFGVAENDAVDGVEVSVAIEGEVVVETDDATIGASNALSVIQTNADGRAVAHAAGTKVGYMLEQGIAVVSGAAATRRCVLRRTL